MKKIKQKIITAFSQVEIKQCEVCGAFISKKEFEAGDGACFKCWDTLSKLN